LPPLQVAPTAVRQTGGVVQIELPPPQVPLVHVSPVVQGSPSLQAVPFGWARLGQIPVVGLQVPAAWH
jgi:hypothetical protein